MTDIENISKAQKLGEPDDPDSALSARGYQFCLDSPIFEPIEEAIDFAEKFLCLQRSKEVLCLIAR